MDEPGPTTRPPTLAGPSSRSLAWAFAGCGVALLFVSAWAVWDETVGRRPWKRYQTELFGRARQVYETRLVRAQQEAKRQQETPRFKAARHAAETGTPPNELGRVAQLRGQVTELESWLEAARARHGAVRGSFQAAAWKLAVDPLDRSARAAVEAGRPRVDETGRAVAVLERQRHELMERERKLLEPARTASRALAHFTRDVDSARRALDALAREKVGLEERQVDIAGMRPGGVIDRCEACHHGARKPGLETLPLPFKTHSGTWLETHPRARFGCMSCHQGDGVATTSVEKAHGHDERCLTPLLPGKIGQAACLKCHDEEARLPGADLLMEGRRLFFALGCVGCHRMRGLDDRATELATAREGLERAEVDHARAKGHYEASREGGLLGPYERARAHLASRRRAAAELSREVRQIAPDLSRVRQKLHPGWIGRWLGSPRAFRPSTRMPAPWPPTTDRELAVENAGEIDAVTAYLWDSAAPSDPGPTGPRDPAAVRRGKELFEAIGCRGCHNLDRSDEPVMGRRRFGPELGRVAEKVQPGWFARWLTGPEKVMPHAKMPSLRVTEPEARDLAAYLSTLGAGAPDPAPRFLSDPVTRRELALKGRAVIARRGCFGCHTIPGFDSHPRIGIELSREGSKHVEEMDYGLMSHELELQQRFGGKVWREWLAARSTSTTSVPALDGPAGAWERWLSRSCEPATLGPVELLFPGPGERRRSRSTRQAWLATKLMDPRAFDRGLAKPPLERLRMPDFGLDAGEILALVTYLLGSTAEVDDLHPGWKYRPGWPRSAVIDGDTVVERFNCAGCHRLDRSFAPGFVASVLRLFKPDVPVSDLAPAELPGVRDPALVHGRLQSLDPGLTRIEHAESEFLEMALRQYEKAALEGELYWDVKRKEAALARQRFEPVDLVGFAPPVLWFEGERARPDWLFGYLKNPETLRPWLRARMPTFDLSDADATRLVRYFAAASAAPFPYTTSPVPELTPATREKASKVLVDACFKCHLPRDPTCTPEEAAQGAPDFKLAPGRLNPGWMTSFTFAPGLYMPDTRMPVLFALPRNNFPAFEDGDALRQAQAMTAFTLRYPLPRPGPSAPPAPVRPTAPGPGPKKR